MNSIGIWLVLLFAGQLPRIHTHSIDTISAKSVDSSQSQSHAREKRASGNAVFQNPWLETDWEALGKSRIIENNKMVSNKKRAKNVILFIGDGMGIQTTAAARVFKGQKYNLKGEKIYLAWEKMPHASLSRTYNVDRITPDSAGTGTAYLSGVKANFGTLGVNKNVEYQKCKNVEGNEIESILHKSILEGKSVGIVTNTRVTHASPAAAYASTPHRDWEGSIPIGAEECVDIASQLILNDRNQDIRVIFGGGSQMFLPNNSLADDRGGLGIRNDGRNLIEEWMSRKKVKKLSHKVLRSKKDLEDLNTAETDYVLGLFESSHMNYEMDRDPAKEPSLTEMVVKAIEILRKNPKGYFLFVEAGRIDQAHHKNLGQKALEDTLMFDQTVTKALEIANTDETLMVVSADHSHTFSVSGYSKFEENILGFADDVMSDIKDKKPALQMGYVNGPGAKYHRYRNDVEIPRINLKDLGNKIYEKEFMQDAGVWTTDEHHGAEDVGVYSIGPWSHLFIATEEQSYLAHVMMYASCVGQYKGEKHCAKSASYRASPDYLVSLLSVSIVVFISKF